MISDSFGNNKANSFASRIRRVTQVWVPDRNTVELRQQVAKLIPFDLIVMLFNEG